MLKVVPCWKLCVNGNVETFDTKEEAETRAKEVTLVLIMEECLDSTQPTAEEFKKQLLKNPEVAQYLLDFLMKWHLSA